MTQQWVADVTTDTVLAGIHALANLEYIHCVCKKKHKGRIRRNVIPTLHTAPSFPSSVTLT
jgi:hypothetical protein